MTTHGDRDRAHAVIRAPNHLGELVLALPALTAASEAWTAPAVVQVVEDLVPVVRLSGLDVETLPLADRHRVLRAALDLRRRRPDAGVLLTPSFSAALIFALAGVRARRGTDTDGRRWLLTDAVAREPLLRGHRVREYLRLVGERAERRDGGRPPRPRLRRLAPAREAWRALCRREGIPGPETGGPVVGVLPGGTSSARRWPAARYADLAGRLAGRGCRVRVFGGPGETATTARVAGADGGVRDLGGRTDLRELAGGLASSDVVVGNDTGPMHLAAAAGRPLVVVWGSGDPVQTRPLSPSVRLLGGLGLPCHPCLEAACPRRGPGYRSDRARRECLKVVPVEEVEAAVAEALSAPGDDAGGEASPAGTGSAAVPAEGPAGGAPDA